MRRVTMRDIAERAGVTKMTVSLALRGSGKLRGETVARIRALAAEMGYAPDPALRALSTHKQQLHTADKGEVIALLVDGPERAPWESHTFVQRFKEGVEAGARRLGYRVEPFWAGDAPGERLGRMLQARGIRSVVLAPEPVGRKRLPLELDWSPFAVVRLGRTHRDISVPCVSHDHYGAVRMAMQEVARRGYRRPALAHTRHAESRLDHRYSASFQVRQQELPEADRLPPLLSDKRPFPEELFLAYLERHQPDVVLSSDSALHYYLLKHGHRVPEDIGFLSLNVQDNQPHMSGIDQDLAMVGAAAVDLCDLLIRTNARGLASVDHTVALGGRWQEGVTLRGPSLRDE
jgi:DNA-binding LacI/PurR family transcriptional regulator